MQEIFGQKPNSEQQLFNQAQQARKLQRCRNGREGKRKQNLDKMTKWMDGGWIKWKDG